MLLIQWLGYEEGECQKRIEVGERACIDAEDWTDMKEQGPSMLFQCN